MGPKSARGRADIWHALSVLADTDASCANTDALRVLSLASATEVGVALTREKVVGIVAPILARELPGLVSDATSADTLRDRIAELAKIESSLPAMVEALLVEGRECAPSLRFIKGIAARRWYASANQRDLGDIDVMVDSADEAYSLVVWLKQRGYDYEPEELPWIKADSGGVVYGVVNLTPADLLLPVIDVHFGRYSARHCSYLRPGSDSDDSWHVAVIVANAAGDNRVTVKDLNDLHRALLHGGATIDSIAIHVGEAGLEAFFGAMLRILDQERELPDAVKASLARMVSRVRPERPGPSRFGRHEWLGRWCATVLHAASYGARQSPWQAFRLSASACAYYARPHRLHASPFARSAELARLNAWTCVRLVPLGQDNSQLPVSGRVMSTSSLHIVHSREGDLVRVGQDLFYPTVSYGVPTRILSMYESTRPGGA